MASGLALWEMDPFFAAAEDVQQSADRMESLYRVFLHSKVLAEGNTIELKGAELSRRELATAIDTAKWQLEEFEKAVTEVAQLPDFQMGEDAPKRHFSFIDAIKDQISMIENALQECIDPKAFNSLHLVDFDDNERDQLALFLSGCTSTEIFTGGDDRIYPIEESDVEEIPSSISLNPHRFYEPFKKNSHGAGLECTFRNKQYGTGGSGCSLSSSELLDKGIEGEHMCHSQIVHANSSVSRDRGGSENVWKGTDCKDGSYNSSTDGKLRSNVDESNKAMITDNIIIDSNHLDSLLKARQINQFQLPGNVFKRWKNGYQGISAKEEILMAYNNRTVLDLEENAVGGDSRSSRTSSDGHSEKQQLPMRKGCIKQRLCSLCRAAFGLSGCRATLVVMVLCLFCMYLWFLSSLVPYMSTVFPQNFQDSS